ncbi:MAG TPA: hypothetical protein VLA56_19705 [Pseudomonadales bacterium]|nr:hypothetical protein [Pseudomonadales bacterium]
MVDERSGKGARPPRAPVDAAADERALFDAWHRATEDGGGEDGLRPPPLLDARILRAARDAGAPARTRRAAMREPRRWATAATLILAVAIAWLVPRTMEPDPFADSAAGQTPPSSPAAVEADARAARARQDDETEVEEAVAGARRMEARAAASSVQADSAPRAERPADAAAVPAPPPSPAPPASRTAAPDTQTATGALAAKTASAPASDRAFTGPARELEDAAAAEERIEGTLARAADGGWHLHAAGVVLDLRFPPSGAPAWLADDLRVEVRLTAAGGGDETGRRVLAIERVPPAD